MTIDALTRVRDPKTITKELKRAASDGRWLEANWQRLAQRHKNELVGVLHKQPIYGKTVEELTKKARDKGWDAGRLVVKHLTLTRPPRIL